MPALPAQYPGLLVDADLSDRAGIWCFFPFLYRLAAGRGQYLAGWAGQFQGHFQGRCVSAVRPQHRPLHPDDSAHHPAVRYFFAILIYGAGRLRAIYQTVYFMPFMATAVAMLIVWEFVLNPTVGVWKAVADLSGVSPINLLRNEATALPILAMISIWQNLGFAVVLFLAGLSGIPGEMYEAAELDGADDAFSRFRRITWPMVGHVTFFVVVMLTVRSFQVFESVAVLTQGGPNDATEVLTYTMYKEGFDFFRTNIASAITVVFLLVIGTLMILKATWLEKKVHYS